MLKLKKTVVLLNLGLGSKQMFSTKPTASEVLTSYLKQCNEPPWTSYFVKDVHGGSLHCFKYDVSTSEAVGFVEVLTSYLKQCNEPPWTSYFVKYSSVKDDQFGMSNFNWRVGASNYQILRTGCFPYMKYHCSRRKYEDLTTSDGFIRIIKILNLGIPCLLYGLAATQLIRHEEIVHTPKGNVTIYFLLPEHKGSMY